MGRETKEPTTLVDALFAEVGRAAIDIRQKLVEEPWFGRAVTRASGGHAQSVAEELGWVRPEGATPEPARDAERTPGHDFDR